MAELFLNSSDVYKIRSRIDGKDCPRGMKAGTWKMLQKADSSLFMLSMDDVRRLAIMDGSIAVDLGMLRPEISGSDEGENDDT